MPPFERGQVHHLCNPVKPNPKGREATLRQVEHVEASGQVESAGEVEVAGGQVAEGQVKGVHSNPSYCRGKLEYATKGNLQ